MKANKTLKRALHLLLALVLVLPGLLWKQDQAFATGTTWRDITSNADAGARNLTSANGKLYLLYETAKKILVRGASDTNWTKLADLPANQFTSPFKLVVRSDGMYIADRGDVNAHPAIASKVMKSTDNGQTWTEVTPPSGGFPVINGFSLHTLFFDSNDNMYVADYSTIYKRDTNGVWTTIAPYPEDSNYTYRFYSAAADATGKLYSVTVKIMKMMPTSGQTAALYSYDGNAWTKIVAPLPASNMILYNDANGGIQVAQGLYDFFLTPAPNIYTFNGTTFDNSATTDSYSWTSSGVVYAGGYYYIADGNPSGKIRTTDPTFGDVKASPTLIADTTDNDTTHSVELTYTDDADWRDAITSVVISPNVPGAQVDYSQAGKITVSGLTTAGTYTITVKATGYADAVATQSIVLKASPALTADTSDNDTTHALELAFADDADWRAAITDVVVTRGVTVANPVYSVQSGSLTLTGLNTPGNYNVKIIANGYQDTDVNQQVNLTPSEWFDITADLNLSAPFLSVNEAVYAFQPGTTSLYYRSPSDIQWKSVDWPQGEFGFVYSFVSHRNNWYVADITMAGPSSSTITTIRISTDGGATWSPYTMPSNYDTTGSLNQMTVSPTGAVYLFNGKYVFKLDENHNWSQIPVFPDAGNFKFAYSGIAVNASGTLYANIRRYNPIMPLDNSAKMYKYDEAGPQWVEVAESPSANLQLYTDVDGGIHAATQSALFGETPRAYVYTFDENGFTDAATLDSLDQVRYALAFDHGYYYTVDKDFKTIRTTNPNFFTGLTSPTVTPDTSDNDAVHPLELTFTDDADWRSNITGVTIKKDGSVVSATYQMLPGVLQISQPLPAGSYTIEITATGYKKASVQQTVVLRMPPTLSADTTDNDTAHAIELTFADDTTWRSAIADVSVTKGGTVVNAVYSVQSGRIALTGLDTPGEYSITVKANGHEDASVTQQVKLAPTVWYDITADSELSAPALSVNEAVYAVQMGAQALYYRNPNDIQWQSREWPQGEFGMVYSFVSRGSNLYVGDITTSNPMTPGVIAVHVSSDGGATWSSYPLPQNLSIIGALTPLTVSPTGAVYLVDGKNVTKLSEARTWSQIPVIPNTGNYSYAFTGAAVDGSGTLFANIRRYDPMLPLDNTAKLYKYDELGEQWVFVADSPSAFMHLYTDSSNGMHAVTATVMNGESPEAYVYKFDGNGFTAAATLDSIDQARYGLAYENGYYYTVDKDFKTILTTNPNFFTGLSSPTVTPDTTNNDDLHLLELTFPDNADWRSNITGVTIKKDGSVISAAYQMLSGVLKITQALPAGSYTIEITAAGYKKVSVQQTVQITAPALIADSTQNDIKHDIEITFADNEAWRGSVTSVAYNGTTADNSMYELSAGKLTFFAGKLPTGSVQIVVTASGYPDASVTQMVSQPSSSSSSGPATSGGNKEIIKIDVRRGSGKGNLVSQAEIIRTTDDKGFKSDQVSFTAELASRAVEAMNSSKTGQAVIVVPDTKDEVSSTQVLLPREALSKLTKAGIGLTIETRGATIEIPVSSLGASSEDLYFHVVPIKDSAAQQTIAERARANSTLAALNDASVVGRPMTIETNLQSHPVTLILPLGSYPAERAGHLQVYIEHSDGAKEWVKGEPTTDEEGGAAIRFTVTKFSTFTIIDSASFAQAGAYIQGYEDGTFRPDQEVTRGQLAAMLSRLYGGDSVNTAKAPAYKDKDQFAAWAASAISQVSALGLMEGYEDGTFHADRAVTRAETAVIAARLAKLNDAAQPYGFADTAGHWAASKIDAAAKAGLLQGYGDGRFEPDRTLNRAEAVTIINRLIGRAAINDQAPHWSDVPAAHWAFGDIQAASLNSAK